MDFGFSMRISGRFFCAVAAARGSASVQILNILKNLYLKNFMTMPMCINHEFIQANIALLCI